MLVYADDTQVIGRTKISNVPPTVNQLQQCIVDIRDWCVSRRLQLNPSNTELIWFGSRASHTKLTSYDLSLRVDCDDISPVDTVRDLGAMLDCELSMQRHVSKVTSICFFHIRRLKQIRRLWGPDVTATLVSAQWLKWFCEAGGSPDEARLEQTPYPFQPH